MSAKYTGDIRPESHSDLYPYIVSYKPFDRTFEAYHSDGEVKAKGFKTYDACVAWIQQQ